MATKLKETLDSFFAAAEQRLAGLKRGSDEYNTELSAIEAELGQLDGTRIAEIDRASQARLDALMRGARKATIEQAAHRIVSEIAIKGCHAALLPTVIARLDTEQRGDDLVVVVNDEAGKKSTMSLEDLADEFRATPALRPVVRSSTADAEGHARRVAETLGRTVH